MTTAAASNKTGICKQVKYRLQSELVCAVYYKDDALRILEVHLPQTSVSACSRHVDDRQIETPGCSWSAGFNRYNMQGSAETSDHAVSPFLDLFD